MMRLLFFLLFVISTSIPLAGQEKGGRVEVGLGINSGLMLVPTYGRGPQPYFGMHLNSSTGNRFLFELSVAHASTRTNASSEALAFINAKPKNYQNTIIDLLTHLRLFNVTEHVALYGGIGITQIQTRFNYLYRVEKGFGNTVVDVEHEQRSGGLSSPLASVSFRSKRGTRWQACIFGTISLLATRPDGGALNFIQGGVGSSSGSFGSGSKRNYIRAGVELSYRLR